jgi:hypothetical protein
VGATANNNWNVDAVGDIPTNCPSSFFIGVSSTDRNDAKVSASGYGVQSIDLAAPGAGVYSTYPTSTYTNMTGTSMASPHVAGSVALLYAAACDTFLMSTSPDSAATVMKLIVLNSVDPKPGFDTLYGSGGRLNVNNALIQLQQQYGGCTPVGVAEEHSHDAMLNLFPNPATMYVTARFENVEKGAHLQITDMAGRLIQLIPIDENDRQINISGLDEGVYFLTFVSGTQRSKAHKLIRIN